MSTTVMWLLLAGVVGYTSFSMGLFNAHIEGLAEASGSTGSNPLNVVLNIIPSNIITAFGSNGAVLSSVFLAVATGLSMNALGESRTATMRRLMGEVNDVVVVFLNFVVTKFAPFAVFVLLTRTFAIYGVDYLKPALVYVVITVIRQYIEPKIVGQTLGVNPLVTLMGLYFGLKIFGFIGMFLVPLAVMTVKAFNAPGRIHLYNPPARERAAAEATLRAADQPKKPQPNPFKKKK